MRVNIELSGFSERFLWELAGKTESSILLDRIVDFAINEYFYKDSNNLDEDEFFLEAAAENPNLSKQSKYKLIAYKESSYVRWSILGRKDLDAGLIFECAQSETDISLIDWLIENHEVDSSAADVIASRIISGEITADGCVRDFNETEMENTVRKIIPLCSKYKAELELWLEDQ